MFSISYYKLFLFLRYLHFCPDFLVTYKKKRLDKRAMFNFKIYDVTDLRANNYNTHIAQFLKK